VVIKRDDIYWVDVGPPRGSGPGDNRPHIVVQNDAFNQSRLNTVIVCALTSNVWRGGAPGNVRLYEGEAGLSQESVVVVSQLYTVDKSELGEFVGTVSRKRVNEILKGINTMTEPHETDDEMGEWKS
jgi:mRNA interferase MazF